MTTNYSDNCIRGIRKAEWIDRGFVTSLAFDPDYKIKRVDQGYETSINWEDDDKVVNYTLKQPTAVFGAVRLPRKAIDRLNEKPLLRDCIKYERKLQNRNRYHGNIVYLGCLPKSRIRAVAGALALEVTEIFRPNQSP